MAYEKTNWVDGETPINATNLNKMEEGIAKANHTISLPDILPKNAGSHNSVYRGKDITDLFYNGTLSEQIANQTFDDIFIGDYIIGKNSGRKYLVADINYRLNTGDTKTTTPHILMFPERIMGKTKMNNSLTSTGAYAGSDMYKTNLNPYRTIINNDFGTEHILNHRAYFKNAVASGGYESGGSFYDSTVDLMNEKMVYGTLLYNNITHGTNIPQNYDIDKSPLAIFRYRHDLMAAIDDNGNFANFWLRDVSSTNIFMVLDGYGGQYPSNANIDRGVRPAFLVY